MSPILFRTDIAPRQGKGTFRMGVIPNDTRLRSCVIMVGCGTSMNCSYRMHASRRQFVWVSIEAHSIYAWKVWSRARGNMHPSILSKLFRFDRTAEAALFPRRQTSACLHALCSASGLPQSCIRSQATETYRLQACIHMKRRWYSNTARL